MKISLRRDVACKVSSAERGKWTFFAALARTKGDIKIASDQNLDGYLSVLFPYRSELQGYWKPLEIDFSLFRCVSLTGWQTFTENKHSQRTVCTESR